MNDLITSIIRTVVPTVVGSLLAWLVAAGVDLNPETTAVDANPALAASLSAALITVCVGAYYALARLAERRWPQAGWLLGSPKQPTYDSTAMADQDEDESGPPSAAPPEWLAQAGTARGDVLPEAPIIDDGSAVKP